MNGPHIDTAEVEDQLDPRQYGGRTDHGGYVRPTGIGNYSRARDRQTTRGADDDVWLLGTPGRPRLEARLSSITFPPREPESPRDTVGFGPPNALCVRQKQVHSTAHPHPTETMRTRTSSRLLALACAMTGAGRSASAQQDASCGTGGVLLTDRVRGLQTGKSSSHCLPSSPSQVTGSMPVHHFSPFLT